MTDPYAALLGAFERAAPSYDRGGIEFFAPFGERLAELAALEPGERVLDIACGGRRRAAARSRARRTRRRRGRGRRRARDGRARAP